MQKDKCRQGTHYARKHARWLRPRADIQVAKQVRTVPVRGWDAEKVFREPLEGVGNHGVGKQLKKRIHAKTKTRKRTKMHIARVMVFCRSDIAPRFHCFGRRGGRCFVIVVFARLGSTRVRLSCFGVAAFSHRVVCGRFVHATVVAWASSCDSQCCCVENCDSQRLCFPYFTG